MLERTVQIVHDLAMMVAYPARCLAMMRPAGRRAPEAPADIHYF